MEDWRERLRTHVADTANAERVRETQRVELRDVTERFMKSVVEPALLDLKSEFEGLGKFAEIYVGRESSGIKVRSEELGHIELDWTIALERGILVTKVGIDENGKHYTATGFVDGVMGLIAPDQIIYKVIGEYQLQTRSRI